ncbi:hypothetical protein PputUW4_02125 [Pseudomonas sp. UW4]|nr:hypothetical protein PputUW4_02125 [Pseudomonas sp. UW4]
MYSVGTQPLVGRLGKPCIFHADKECWEGELCFDSIRIRLHICDVLMRKAFLARYPASMQSRLNDNEADVMVLGRITDSSEEVHMRISSQWAESQIVRKDGKIHFARGDYRGELSEAGSWCGYIQNGPKTPENNPGITNLLVAAMDREIVYHISEHAADLIFLHAAVAQKSDQEIVLIGDSGMGKSTLSKALCENGWTLLTDDIAPWDPSREIFLSFPRVSMFNSAPNFNNACILKNTGLNSRSYYVLRRGENKSGIISLGAEMILSYLYRSRLFDDPKSDAKFSRKIIQLVGSGKWNELHLVDGDIDLAVSQITNQTRGV